MDIQEIFKTVFLSKEKFRVGIFMGYDFDKITIDTEYNFVNVCGSSKFMDMAHQAFRKCKNAKINLFF